MIDELSHPYRMALLQNKGPEAYLKQINIDIARVVNRLQFRIGEAKPGTAATLLQLNIGGIKKITPHLPLE